MEQRRRPLTRALTGLSAVTLLVALAWMVAATFPMVWTTQSASGDFETIVTHHSWLDPITFGNGSFQAPLVTLLTAVADVLAWLCLVRGRASTPAAVWSGLALVVLLAWPTTWTGWDVILVLPIVLLCVATAAAAAARIAQGAADRRLVGEESPTPLHT